jgi:hypothetical protein
MKYFFTRSVFPEIRHQFCVRTQEGSQDKTLVINLVLADPTNFRIRAAFWRPRAVVRGRRPGPWPARPPAARPAGPRGFQPRAAGTAASAAGAPRGVTSDDRTGPADPHRRERPAPVRSAAVATRHVVSAREPGPPLGSNRLGTAAQHCSSTRGQPSSSHRRRAEPPGPWPPGGRGGPGERRRPCRGGEGTDGRQAGR